MCMFHVPKACVSKVHHVVSGQAQCTAPEMAPVLCREGRGVGEGRGFQHSSCLDVAMLSGWRRKHHEAHLCQQHSLTCQDAAEWGWSQTWAGGKGPLASTHQASMAAGGHHCCCSPQGCALDSN